MVVSAVLQLENIFWGPILAGFLVGILGALLWSNDRDRWAYVRSRTGSDVGWVELPYDTGGWPARSSAQLEAVIELSDNGEGDALVRNRADGTAEVATKRDGHRHTCLVDPTGAVHNATVVPPTASQRSGIRVRKAGAVVFWLSWLAIFISVTAALACLGSGTLMWLTGLLLEQSRQSQASGDDGYGSWYKVVTYPPDS